MVRSHRVGLRCNVASGATLQGTAQKAAGLDFLSSLLAELVVSARTVLSSNSRGLNVGANCGTHPGECDPMNHRSVFYDRKRLSKHDDGSSLPVIRLTSLPSANGGGYRCTALDRVGGYQAIKQMRRLANQDKLMNQKAFMRITWSTGELQFEGG